MSDKLFTEMVCGYMKRVAEDVPDASLMYCMLNSKKKHNVDQLRGWLSGRGIKRLGNKTAFLER